MSSNQPKHVDAVGADKSGSGFLAPDAGPDTARADYSDEADTAFSFWMRYSQASKIKGFRRSSYLTSFKSAV
ncbi:hypothetical protein [Coleofasciculus sp. H7-2]|uniref:hypothetical protein n=1 Tax=Coleofasciculus sp. H7-2 TaxID=3351545 RepID=UPI00366D2D42